MTSTVTTTLTSADCETFWRDGVVRVRAAFAAEDATEMREVVWRTLARRGVDRHDRRTWDPRAAHHLQHLKGHPAFARIGTERTLGAIADLLPAWPRRAVDWGAFFLTFPVDRPWTVPWQAWHVDHRWTSVAEPLDGLKVHAAFGTIAPRAGEMTVVAGSHRLVAAALSADPPSPGARPAATRASVMRSCDYLRALGTNGRGDPATEAARIARFVDREELALGCPVQVRELTADPGDVFLIHPPSCTPGRRTPGRSRASCSTRISGSADERGVVETLVDPCALEARTGRPVGGGDGRAVRRRDAGSSSDRRAALATTAWQGASKPAERSRPGGPSRSLRSGAVAGVTQQLPELTSTLLDHGVHQDLFHRPSCFVRQGRAGKSGA